jgi:hypothetical protein
MEERYSNEITYSRSLRKTTRADFPYEVHIAQSSFLNTTTSHPKQVPTKNTP